MIQGSFMHVTGIGPVTDRLIRDSGFETWDDCLLRGEKLPLSVKRKNRFLGEIGKSKSAHDKKDLKYLLSRFHSREHWRILAEFVEYATFFDIETTGLSWHYCHASVIAALHKGRILTFMYGSNLDGFLDILDEAELLVTFNGSSFDLPFIEKTFNIPPVGIPHIDLRWVAFHQGYTGGLKSIERQIGISRPREVRDIDGFEAVDLFHRWQAGESGAGADLARYCRTDAVCTYILAGRLLEEKGSIPGPIDENALFMEAMEWTEE